MTNDTDSTTVFVVSSLLPEKISEKRIQSQKTNYDK